jgi:pimeloyl-ACP methyl ester carboxylesterase
MESSTLNPDASAKPMPTTELFYESLNPSATETILLIHGACGSHKEWDDVAPDLILKGYHVLLPDLPAHGNSSKVQPFSIKSATDIIINLIAAQAKQSRAHIVGLSLGAHIAACIAEHAKPGMILSVIASGYNTIPQPRFLTPILTPPIFVLHHITNLVASPREGMAQLKNGEAGYGLMAAVVKAICEPRKIGAIRVRLLAVCAASPETYLGRDKVECSKMLLESVVDWDGSRAVLHRGIRHGWHMEEPAMFAEMVLAWVREEKLDDAFEDLE